MSILSKMNEKRNYSEINKVHEGKKRYYTMDNVGKAKYTVNYYDGKSQNKDGSDFFGIKIFKNKKEVALYIKELVADGYVEGK